MLGADQVVSALARFRVPELTALALSHRIPSDNDVSPLYQALAQGLVVHLPVLGMARWHKDRGMFAVPIFGHIDQRRNIDSRQTFKNQLLDSKTIHLNLSRDAGMKWRSFSR